MEEELEKDMKPKFIEDLGMRYPTEKSKHKARYGLFECPYCGNHWEVITSHINTGQTKSCGCQINKQKITHGLRNNQFYKTWHNMIQRCTNPNNKQYKNYGGRGITVCGEWLDVRNFVDWTEKTYPNIEGYTVDRIDNDKGYSPDNCRWADSTTQNTNQRMKKNNTSGYVGVIWHIQNKRWIANIRISKKLFNLGSFKDKIEAVLARDNYIVENKLPHKLSILNTGL